MYEPPKNRIKNLEYQLFRLHLNNALSRPDMYIGYDNIDKALEILHAFRDCKTIQFYTKEDDEWVDVPDGNPLYLDDPTFETVRVKPDA